MAHAAAGRKTNAERNELNNVGWLDVHYEACRPEYEAMLDLAGLQPGWRVLDAGCGSGAYFAAIWERVSPGGTLSGVDLSERNAEAANQLGQSLGGEIDARQGSLTALPYEDGEFDAAWCANVSWLLDDDELMTALGEFQRVLRPGGVVAVKDVDMSAIRISPAPPFLGPHLAEACVTGDDVTTDSVGSLRGRELRAWLERAGFEAVQQRTFTIERWAPLKPAEAKLWSEWLPYLAELAIEKNVPEEDLVVWRQVATPEDAMRFVSQPGFYCCELQTVAIGRARGKQR